MAWLPVSSVVLPPAQTAVGTSSGVVAVANTSRCRIMVQNTGTTILRLALGPTAPTGTAYHIALPPCTVANDGLGGTWIDDMWQGQVQAISSAAGGLCVVTELIFG